MTYRHVIILSIFAVASLTAGCRRVYTFVPVEGTITQGGKPLAGVQVFFYADPDSSTMGPRSWGTTDEAGHYRLHTDNGDDGAVVGQHCVWFLEPASEEERLARSPSEMMKTASTKSERPQTKVVSKVPAIYGSVHKTPLRAEVRPGSMQTFDFDIPSSGTPVSGSHLE